MVDDTAGQRPNRRLEVMVVGLGMVGIAFIEKLLSSDDRGRYFVRTCGEEPVVAYNRVGLTEYFQHRNVEDLYLNKLSWYSEQDPEHFAFHVGEQVTHIDTTAKSVRTSKDNEFRYDILVLATGSKADIPRYISATQVGKTQGLFLYRNIADLEAIIAFGEQSHVKKGVVVGGGLLGLEAAKALYDLPSVPDVSLVIRKGYPLNRQLDARAGELVLKKIRDIGVNVHTACEPTAMTVRHAEDGTNAFTGLQTPTGALDADMVIFAIGIRPRDELAFESGIRTAPRGGVEVNDDLETSANGVYAVGECASWRGNTYGLIAPGIEMADILAFNLTQIDGVAAHSPRKMNPPDLSTRLKLMGVDVASFGDYFADERALRSVPKAGANGESAKSSGSNGPNDAPPNGNAGEVSIRDQKPSRQGRQPIGGPVDCLTYYDPFSATYKKYIFSQDGRYLLGGMMIGDVGDFTKLVAITKRKKQLDVPPAEFILGAKKEGDDNGDDLDDDTTICSCHNVSKGKITACVKDGITDLAQIKSKTKAGAGCGGCVPLVTGIYKTAMKNAGHAVNNFLCPHFKMSRKDLFQVIKIKILRDFKTVMDVAGLPGAIGCELCKPAVASILSSLYNEHVMKTEHHHNQDTNDRFLANIQRNGTFSVVPRIPGGEIHPDKLVAIGKVASEYGLYTKITGGQRIDMFGAQKADLPDIWTKLHAAGLESGHAYGKALRTIKSCVGTTWCRFGVGDSVGLAIDLENRYRGVRAPHKFKGGVSGCVRECAEAQSKDFGLIATDKGWNIFVAGNGGMKPRHAQLFAQDVPPNKVLMFYIRTADKLQRTAPWMEGFEGGLEKLRRILLEDELGICADLEREMDSLIGTYEDEWKKAVDDPVMRRQFRQFVNTEERRPAIEAISERGQTRAADWPKAFPSEKLHAGLISTPKDQWRWIALAQVDDLTPNGQNTTSVAVRYGADTQLAIFHVPGKGYYATQQMCPHKRAFVLDHGIVGDDGKGNVHVSCPLHKRNYRLEGGECSNDSDFSILTFDAKAGPDDKVLVLLPPEDVLDAILGTAKWMVKRSTAEALGQNPATAIGIVAPTGAVVEGNREEDGAGFESQTCGSSKLEW